MASRSLSFFKFQRFSVEINGHFYSKLKRKAKAIAFDEIDKAPEEKKRGNTIATVLGALRDSSQSGALGASRGSGLHYVGGHTTPALFYLALGGSLLSYIYSAPPLKLGIAIVYNFKSVEGDRAMGLQSLLVAFGTEAAKWICVSAIDVTQISVAGM
ncbi:hypothetical protein YC2023_000893 [Brassica napus]